MQITRSNILDTIVHLGNIHEAQLIVTGKIYPNVVISFGKYQRTIDREFANVLICMNKNDIAIKANQYNNLIHLY